MGNTTLKRENNLEKVVLDGFTITKLQNAGFKIVGKNDPIELHYSEKKQMYAWFHPGNGQVRYLEPVYIPNANSQQ